MQPTKQTDRRDSLFSIYSKLGEERIGAFLDSSPLDVSNSNERGQIRMKVRKWAGESLHQSAGWHCLSVCLSVCLSCLGFGSSKTESDHELKSPDDTEFHSSKFRKLAWHIWYTISVVRRPRWNSFADNLTPFRVPDALTRSRWSRRSQAGPCKRV